MTNLSIIDSLLMFYDKCLRSGFVKIKNFNSSGITLIISPGFGGSPKDSIRHVDTIIMNPKKVCWITPKRSKKNIDMLNEIKGYSDKLYISVCPKNGLRYQFKAYSISGKCIKTWNMKLFSINL